MLGTPLVLKEAPEITQTPFSSTATTSLNTEKDSFTPSPLRTLKTVLCFWRVSTNLVWIMDYGTRYVLMGLNQSNIC